MHKLLKAIEASEDIFKNKLVEPLAMVIKALKLDPKTVKLNFDTKYYPYEGFVGEDVSNEMLVSHTMVSELIIGSRPVIRQVASAQDVSDGKIEVKHEITILLTKEEHEAIRIDRSNNDKHITGQ